MFAAGPKWRCHCECASMLVTQPDTSNQPIGSAIGNNRTKIPSSQKRKTKKMEKTDDSIQEHDRLITSTTKRPVAKMPQRREEPRGDVEARERVHEMRMTAWMTIGDIEERGITRDRWLLISPQAASSFWFLTGKPDSFAAWWASSASLP